MQLFNNTAESDSGRTFSMENTANVEIRDAQFESNPQSNLVIELGTLDVVNSTFTDGRANHISGIDSKVTID